MFKRRRIFFLVLILISCSHAQNQQQKGDWGRLKSYDDLVALSQSKDYNIYIKHRINEPLVMAIHGGNIERGTSELAREILYHRPISYYILDGIHAPDFNENIAQSGHLHVTAHKFNDPRIIKLAKASPKCLSLHGFPSESLDICIGGGASSEEKMSLKDSLTKGYPELKICIDCCPPYLGRHKNNVVNLCKRPGLQLEMGPELRSSFYNKETILKGIAKILSDFLGSHR